MEKEKRKSVNAKPAAVITSGTTEPISETAAETEPSKSSQSGPPRPSIPSAIRTSMEDQASLRMEEIAKAANADESSQISPTSPKEGNRVKSWLKRLSKRQSKSPKSPVDTEAEPEKRKSFIGGIAMKRSSANNSTVSLGAKSSSIRDVAMAGKGKEKEVLSSEDDRAGRSNKRDSQVSDLSSVLKTDDDEFQEARDNFDEDLIQPSALSTERSSSVARDSKFKEAI